MSRKRLEELSRAQGLLADGSIDPSIEEDERAPVSFGAVRAAVRTIDRMRRQNDKLKRQNERLRRTIEEQWGMMF